MKPTTGFITASGCNRLRNSWICVLGKKGSRPTTVGLRAFFTSGLPRRGSGQVDHELLARFRYITSYETSCSSIRLILLVCLLASLSAADSAFLSNPTTTDYTNEVVRLSTPLPASDGLDSYIVTQNGREIPTQVSPQNGQHWLWVQTSLKAGEQASYHIKRGKPTQRENQVHIQRKDECYILSNDHLAVRVPAVAGHEIPAPIQSIRLGDCWMGAGYWQTEHPLTRFSATVLDEGPLFARIRLHYSFAGHAGLYGKTPAFATIDVSLYAGQHHAVIEETHEMERGSYWEFDCAAGWDARQVQCHTYGRSPPSGGPKVPLPVDLSTGQTRMDDTLVNLQPRWTQAYDEGWFAVCHNNVHAVGATVAFASQWHWPHDNLIAFKVRESGDYAGLRCPTWRGKRTWFLLAGPTALWQNRGAKDYLMRYAFQTLDKLNHDYVITWPDWEASHADIDRGKFQGMDFYSNWMNPTGAMRPFGRKAVAHADQPGNLNTLTHLQAFFDNDSYGSYWNYWSPENPNFFTDYIKPAIAMTARVRQHPDFARFAETAKQKFRTDLYHSITLPGGAGQECPGYVAYAMSHWQELVPLCKAYLGFDPSQWPRFSAGASFLLHLSQPIGNGRRRCHPGGDTHPLGPDVFALAEEFGVHEDIRQFQTEERPGFGVIFRNRPGTERETYLAFKSGPNRGHFHGDQLSFHYCADSQPLAIDHMCSYGPRAGQEHMHNRVVFHSEKLPWANIDGYERLIAFKQSENVDVAIGQVESERLRVTTAYPPEVWDTYLPQQRFKTLLKYRRTIVCMKNRGRDYFVIRDQHVGPELQATWCLHVVSNTCLQEDNQIVFDKLNVTVIEPNQFSFARHDWSFDKKTKQGGILSESTKGIRLTSGGGQTQFITVLYPSHTPPAIFPLMNGVRIGTDEIIFGGGVDDEYNETYITVKRDEKHLLRLTGEDIDMDRSQGEIGLFVPDAGYPFGVIPDWLIKQRNKVPEWAPAWVRQARQYDLE